MNLSEIDQLYYQFKAKAESVSALVFRVPGMEEANLLIAEKLTEFAARQIVISPSGLSKNGKLPEHLQNAGFHIHTTDLRRHAPNADAGISQLDFAIAETGSLAQDASNVESRVVSTLPNIHIALVPTSSLKANLSDALSAFYDNGRVPGYISFITGPSRTSDIERVLTIGVHGPEKLIIVFVDQGGHA